MKRFLCGIGFFISLNTPSRISNPTWFCVIPNNWMQSETISCQLQVECTSNSMSKSNQTCKCSRMYWILINVIHVLGHSFAWSYLQTIIRTNQQNNARSMNKTKALENVLTRITYRHFIYILKNIKCCPYLTDIFI